MQDIARLARYKRFRKKEDVDLSIVISTNKGEQFTLSVEDCSLTGIFAKSSTAGINIDVNSIIPNSKIVFQNEEYPIGRLVCKRCVEHGGTTYLALSVVDIRLPISSFLSKAVSLDLDSGSNELEVELSEKGFTIGDFLTTKFENQDIFDRCYKFELFYKTYKDSDRFAYFFPRNSMTGPRITVRKRGPRKDYLMFGSNDYLNLSCHPEVIEAANRATLQYGLGSTGASSHLGHHHPPPGVGRQGGQNVWTRGGPHLSLRVTVPAWGLSQPWPGPRTLFWPTC